jgi:RNA polymerase sigma-70 factor (ECF subfamily)
VSSSQETNPADREDYVSSFSAIQFRQLALAKLQSDTAPTDEDKAPDTSPSDELLLSRIAQEDREALAILFRRHFRLVHWVGRRILRNSTEAEDLVQDVFLHIARKCHLYDSAKSTARTWILNITYYQALNRRQYLEGRHYYSAVRLEPADGLHMEAQREAEYDRSGEGLFGRVRWPQIREVLTEDQWEAIRLHFYEGCTFAEIAQRRNLDLGNVRHHFYRGIARLRKHLFHDELQDC